MGDGGGEQPVVEGHIAALFGFPVEAVAKFGDGRRLAGRRGFKDGQRLRQAGAAETNDAVGQDVHEIERMPRAGDLPAGGVIPAGIPGAGFGFGAGVALPQAENHARLGGGAIRAGGGCIGLCNGIDAGRHRLERVPIAFQVAQQLGDEVVQRKVAHGGRIVQIFQGKGFMAQPQQLFVAESDFRFGVGLGKRIRKWIFVAAGGDVGQGHARLHPALQPQVLLHIGRGPVVHHLHGGSAAANAVNAPEPLDNAHRVPVDVVVDHSVAVLQVLPLRDAVGGNQQVNVGRAGGGRIRPAAAGHGGKVGEDGVEIVVAGALARAGKGFIAGHHRDVDAQLRGQAAQLVVQVFCRILEGGEYQQLAVGIAVPVGGGVCHFVADCPFDFRQLAVPFRRNGLDLRQGGGEGSPILPQIVRPARQIQFQQPVRMAAAVDEKLLILVIVVGQHVGAGQGICRRVGSRSVKCRLPVVTVAVNPVQQGVNLADGAFQRQRQRVG